MQLHISEAVSRKSMLRNHLCLLVRRGIALGSLYSAVDEVEILYEQN